LKYLVIDVQKMKILICEDDPDILELIEFILTEENYAVTTTEDESTVKNLMEKIEPDLLIIDYWLNGTKADDIINSIKKDDNLKEIPIILISAIDNLEEVSSNLPVVDYIKKPFDINTLKTKVKSYIQKYVENNSNN